MERMGKRKLYSLWIILFLWMEGTGLYGEAKEKISLKNFLEIYHSLHVVTGLPVTPRLASAYTSIREFLPKTGIIDEINATSQIALARLGGFFCEQMVEKDAIQRNPALRHAHAVINFSSFASELEEDVFVVVLKKYANLFWQRPLTTAEEKLFLSWMKEIVPSLPKNQTSIKSLFISTCSLFAGGMDFLKIR